MKATLVYESYINLLIFYNSIAKYIARATKDRTAPEDEQAEDLVGSSVMTFDPDEVDDVEEMDPVGTFALEDGEAVVLGVTTHSDLSSDVCALPIKVNTSAL
jgi:hypothetical protein